MKTQSEPWTLKRLLEWTTQHFEHKGLDAPRLSAELLLADALGCAKLDLYTRFEQIPGAAELDHFRTAVKKAAENYPVAYLLGVKEFYSLEFTVSDAVLIPRPETELLVDKAVEYIRASEQARTLIDMGTGSGCIAIAIAKQCPELLITATDISEQALEIARANAERHDVADRFTFVCADGLRIPSAEQPDGGFDVLVSNPPYVAESDTELLDQSVREHEPSEALFAGSDGLKFYEHLARCAGDILAEESAQFMEIGYDQKEAVLKVFAESPFEFVEGWRDHINGHWRVLQFVRIGKTV